MPGMTTLPILQSAPPANGNPLSGTVAPANIADTAGINAPGTPTAASASSADAAAAVDTGNAAASFAEVLQRQLAQTAPSDLPVPDFLPIADPTLPLQSDAGLLSDPALQPASADTLLADLSNLTEWLSAQRSGPGPVAKDSASATDSGIPVTAGEYSDAFRRALPTDSAAASALQGADLAARVTAPATDDDTPEDIAPDAPAAVVPLIQVVQASAAIEPGSVADDKKPAGSGRSLLAAALAARPAAAPASPGPVLARPETGTEAAPRPAAEFLPNGAGKSAEFAAAQAALNEVSAAQSNHTESIAPATSFDTLLAAAQAVGQHRSSGGHVANSSAPLVVDTPVGSRGWDGEVADKLVWMVGRQEQRAELVLNPPQLGRIEVSLSMSDGQTSALFVSANPAVRDALEAALPRLREILADAGVSLGQTQVGGGSGNSDSSTNNAENRDNSGRGLSNDDLASGNEVLRQLDAPQWLKRGNGLVDTFA